MELPEHQFCPRCGLQHDLSLPVCPRGQELGSDHAPVDEDLVPGTFAGEYRIVSKIGEGGMGTVYEGEHPVIGKRVAIKCLRRELASDGTAVRRFVDEAWAVNRIGHRNIVDIFGFGTLPDGRQYCVMELLHGQDVKTTLEEQGPLPMAQILDVMGQTCKGLAAAHDAAIIHRDIKPDNIFLTPEEDGPDFVHILDFGIAKLADNSPAFVNAATTPYGKPAGFHGGHRTQAGMVVGTPEYLAPERIQPGRPVDHRSDLYALGIIVYQAITGAPPFVGDNPIQVAARHLDEDVPPPSEVVPGRNIPPSVDAFIAKALAKDPGDRHADAREFWTELKEAAAPLANERRLPAGFGVMGQRTFAGGDSLVMAASESTTFEADEEVLFVPRGNKLPWLLGIGVAILTAAFIGTVVSRSGSDDTDEAVVAAKSAEEADDGKAGAGADDEDETASDDGDEGGADEDGVAPTDDDGAKAAGEDDDGVGTAEAIADDGADDAPPVAGDGDGDEAAADDDLDPAVDDAAAGDVEPGGASGDVETGYRRVWIDSRPVGAKVFLLPDMTPMGASPLGVDVADEAESVRFRVVKKGYRTKDVLVRRGEDKVTAKLDKAGKKRPGASVSPPATAAIPKTKPKPKPKTAKSGTLKTPEWMRKK